MTGAAIDVKEAVVYRTCEQPDQQPAHLSSKCCQVQEGRWKSAWLRAIRQAQEIKPYIIAFSALAAQALPAVPSLEATWAFSMDGMPHVAANKTSLDQGCMHALSP